MRNSIKLFVDYTLIIETETKVGAYIGAGHFAREIIMLLLAQGMDISVLVPRGYNPQKEEDLRIFQNANIVRVDDILNVGYEECTSLFLPAANGYWLEKVKKIKKKYRNLLVYAVLHDKQHNITRFDSFDCYYYKGLLRFVPVLFVKYKSKKTVFDILYPKWVKSIDKLFTASNYSLQILGNQCKAKRMTWLFSSTSINRAIPKRPSINVPDDYILFVSGERCEKNLARGLLAFNRFILETNSKTSLIITGIKNKVFDDLVKSLKLNNDFIEKHLIHCGYVDTEELAYLYSNCRYLMFVSKAEGFGLPVLEAMQFKKTVLASRQTSIPEVAGSILYYVDAYCLDSIVEGIKYLSNDDNLKYRESLIDRKIEIINKQIELDHDVLIHELTE